MPSDRDPMKGMDGKRAEFLQQLVKDALQGGFVSVQVVASVIEPRGTAGDVELVHYAMGAGKRILRIDGMARTVSTWAEDMAAEVIRQDPPFPTEIDN